MEHNKIKENLRKNILSIRRKTGLNQENFFDAYDIGEYFPNKIKTQQGKADCISKFENGKKDLPIELLPVYAQIGKCSIEDILGTSGTGLSFKETDPVEDAVQLISSSAYNACKFLYDLYVIDGIEFKTESTPGTSGVREINIMITALGEQHFIKNKYEKVQLINNYLCFLESLKSAKISREIYELANEQKLQMIKAADVELSEGKEVDDIIRNFERANRRDVVYEYRLS